MNLQKDFTRAKTFEFCRGCFRFARSSEYLKDTDGKCAECEQEIATPHAMDFEVYECYGYYRVVSVLSK